MLIFAVISNYGVNGFLQQHVARGEFIFFNVCFNDIAGMPWSQIQANKARMFLSLNEDSHVLRRVRKIERASLRLCIFNHNFKIHEIVPHGVITIRTVMRAG
jgi:hypothetical protein